MSITRDGWCIGAELDGRYRLIQHLGQGGMGEVFKAEHIAFGSQHAIKRLLPDFVEDQSARRRFENEATVLHQLSHINIVKVSDIAIAQDGTPYMALELLTGCDGEALLKAEGRLAITRAVNLVVQASRGLAFAHDKQVVHRDLKPSNLFIDERGRVKVLDFGIAKLRHPGSLVHTLAGRPLGSPRYMSPEQVRNPLDVDRRSDIYSLAVVLYEFLTGVRPHDAALPHRLYHNIQHEPPVDVRVLRPEISKKLAAVLHRALAKERQARFSDMRQFEKALLDAAGRGRTMTLPLLGAALATLVGGALWLQPNGSGSDSKGVTAQGAPVGQEPMPKHAATLSPNAPLHPDAATQRGAESATTLPVTPMTMPPTTLPTPLPTTMAVVARVPPLAPKPQVHPDYRAALPNVKPVASGAPIEHPGGRLVLTSSPYASVRSEASP